MAAAAAAQLLGEDGRGYELARRLESCGAWRAWLGDAAHAAFAPHLASPSTWDAFLSPSPSSSSSRPLLLLQLRARALLFDKASAALLLPSPSPAAGRPASAANLVNTSYLQLHVDDIYFSLDDDREDSSQHQMQSRTVFSPSRESSTLSQRLNRPDELPETWYQQYAEKFRIRHGKFRPSDKEVPKRTPEGMSDYLKLCSVHKKKRRVFADDLGTNISAPFLENGSALHSKNAGDFSNLTDDTFIPEFKFPADCVPDSAIPRTSGISRINKIEFHGVLDNLPAPVSRNTAMLERFGMVPEYYKTGNKYRGKDGSRAEGKSFSQEQALQMTRKLVVRFLANAGFESGTATSMDFLSEVVIKHMSKLGRNLKLLTDSYRKQFSSIELLKMFLQTAGYSNIGPLMEITKVGSRAFPHQVHQDAQALQSQHQNSLLHAQQIQRQLHPQMNVQTQNLAFQQQQQLLQQQQWDRMRRTQMTSPRGSVMMPDKSQPVVNVKIENTMDSPIDGSYGSLTRQQQQQLQLRQQQLQQHHQLQQQQLQQQQHLAMAANQNAQLGQQFKQMPSMNAYSMRMPPVKVEAFHELVSGDSSLKQESDPNKLTSPK